MAVKRLDTDFGRAYVVKKEDDLFFMPSVTTVLGSEPSAYLIELEKKIGKERLKMLSTQGALRGTAMHTFLENYLTCIKRKNDKERCLLYSQKISVDSLVNEMEKKLIDRGRSLFYNIYHHSVLKRIKKIVFIEKFLYSIKYLFAGTADFNFIDINNEIVVVDFKSASSKRNKEIIDKYKCQLAAYILAFEEMYNKKVSRGESWISYGEQLQVEELNGEELGMKKYEFTEICKRYHSTWDDTPFRKIYYEKYEQ